MNTSPKMKCPSYFTKANRTVKYPFGIRKKYYTCRAQFFSNQYTVHIGIPIYKPYPTNQKENNNIYCKSLSKILKREWEELVLHVNFFRILSKQRQHQPHQPQQQRHKNKTTANKKSSTTKTKTAFKKNCSRQG